MKASARPAPPPVPMPPKRRRSSGAMVFVLLLVVAILYGWVRASGGPEPVAAAVSVEAGEISVRHADAGATESVGPGEGITVQEGDEISVHAAGRALLDAGGGQVVLHAGARVAVLEMRRAPLWRGLQMTLGLETGDVAVDMAGDRRPGGSFSLETDIVTIRGDTFACRAVKGEQVTVDGVRGTVWVQQGKDAVTLRNGQHLLARLGQPLQASGQVVPDPTATRRVRPGEPVLSDLDRTLFPVSGSPTSAPEGTTHTVRSGETLSSIARDYGLDAEALWEANRDRLESPDRLRVGQALRVPLR